MAVTAYKSPGTTSNEARASSDGSWSNTDNVKVSDDSRAVVTVPKNDYSDWLRVSNFNMGVPAGATIDGIEVQIEHRADGGEEILDSALYLRKTSGQVGDNFASGVEWAVETDETFTYGGSTNLWNATWSATDINSSDFGLDFSAFADQGNQSPEIDHIQIRVYYTAAAGFTRKIKIAGTFQDKPIKTKVSGTFQDKIIKIKVGGTFQDA